MVSVCFYFQVHQPRRLRRYSVFDITRNQEYFDDDKNREVVHKVAGKCYLPMNALLLDLIRQHKGAFKVSFSISGTALEQFEQYAPEVLASFKELADTGCVEFLSETYYHSLSFMYDKDEFRRQVAMHRDAIKRLFGQEPKVFRNTELIYYNEVGVEAQKLGFTTVLAEGWDPILGWRSPNFVYKARGADTKLLLKNYKLSDDIAFRFGNRAWEEYPLSVEKFERWLSAANGNGDVVNLFMDYETFGEHQWENTGIFTFMRSLPGAILRHPDNRFVTVSDASAQLPARDELDVPYAISWADLERDLSAWLGNKMQHTAINELYRLGKHALPSGNPQTIRLWRYLTTSDHFYYMCTKWFSDGDVHKYFNPYESPYEAYIAFMNVLNDLAHRLNVRDQGATLLSERPSALLATAQALGTRTGGA